MSNNEITNYILTDIKQKFSSLFPLLSQEEIREIVNRAMDTGNTITKAKETKTVCSNCSGALTLSEIIECKTEKKLCSKCASMNMKKVLLEESPEKGTLGDCIRSLKLTPKEIVTAHWDLVASGDRWDNAAKDYTINGKRYEIVCRRQLSLFSHVCKAVVYIYE